MSRPQMTIDLPSSGKTKSRIGEYNAAVRQLESDRHDAAKEPARFVERIVSGEISDQYHVRRDAIVARRISILRREAELWTQRGELLDDWTAYAKPKLEKLETDLQTRKQETEAKLADAGMTTASMPGRNCESAARHQLNHQIRMIPAVQEANAAIKTMRHHLNSTVKEIAAARTYAESCQNQLRQLAESQMEGLMI